MAQSVQTRGSAATRAGTGSLDPSLQPRELFFPVGLPAFEQHHNFVLVADERYLPLLQLQSLDDAAVGFLVVDPLHLVESYAPDLADQDVGAVELEEGEAPELLCMLVVHSAGLVTLNLKAPIVVNARRQRGKQIILTDDRFPLRAPVDLSAAWSAPAGEQPCLS